MSVNIPPQFNAFTAEHADVALKHQVSGMMWEPNTQWLGLYEIYPIKVGIDTVENRIFSLQLSGTVGQWVTSL